MIARSSAPPTTVPFPTPGLLFRLDALLLTGLLFTSDLQIPTDDGAAGVPIWLIACGPIAAIGIFLDPPRLRSAFTAFFWSTAFVAVNIYLSQILFSQATIRQYSVAFFVALAVGSIAPSIKDLDDLPAKLVVAFKIFLTCQFTLMMLQLIFGVFLFKNTYPHYLFSINRVSGFASEPSHLAVQLAAPLGVMIGYPKFWTKNFSVFYKIITILIIIICPSSTILATIFIALLVSLIRFLGSLWSSILAIFVIIFLPSVSRVRTNTDNPVAQRIGDLFFIFQGYTSDSLNLSSLLLAKGIFVMRAALDNFPLGVGLDNFPQANSLYAFQFSTVFGAMNDHDGTSFAVKFVTEFGWPGAFYFFAGAAYLLMSSTMRRTGLVAMTAFCVLAANTVRGAGYFDLGTLFPIVVLACLIAQRFNSGAARPQQAKVRGTVTIGTSV